jgi:hypothetical protein
VPACIHMIGSVIGKKQKEAHSWKGLVIRCCKGCIRRTNFDPSFDLLTHAGPCSKSAHTRGGRCDLDGEVAMFIT